MSHRRAGKGLRGVGGDGQHLHERINRLSSRHVADELDRVARLEDDVALRELRARPRVERVRCARDALVARARRVRRRLEGDGVSVGGVEVVDAPVGQLAGAPALRQREWTKRELLRILTKAPVPVVLSQPCKLRCPTSPRDVSPSSSAQI